MVRLVSSGTEATMTAIRLARGFTGRSRIVKFEGCYHGHADALLVKAGSGALTLGVPSSAGVPPEVTAHTLVLDYNDIDGVRRAFDQHGREIAAVIVEPVVGNMNLVLPVPGFLEGLRELCTRHGAVLIFDEVMTGFRVGLQGVQGLHGIRPDLTTLGKVVGGGMPLAAFGGRRDIMQCIAPLGPVYQAGTLSGNPVAVAAGLATLKLIQAPGFFERLSEATRSLARGLQHGRAPGRREPERRVGGRDVRDIFRAAPAAHLRAGDGLRPRCVQPVFPRHAARGRVLCTVSLRGRVRLGRAHRAATSKPPSRCSAPGARAEWPAERLTCPGPPERPVHAERRKMYSATACMSWSLMRPAMVRIMLEGSLSRSPARNALS